MKNLSIIFSFCFTFLLLVTTIDAQELKNENQFLGMWTLDIENGNVGWLHVHEDNGYLDASVMWEGGSVLPAGHAYLADDHTLVVTRVFEKELPDTNERKHYLSYVIRFTKVKDKIIGHFEGPRWDGNGEVSLACIGKKLPPMNDAPDLSKVKYGSAINLFNGKDLSGWSIIHPSHKNGFKVVNGELRNDPTQIAGEDYIYYGNLRTAQEFEDFNLNLEVNVPEGDNSGIYLKGIYEVQVYDSYGKELDSHHMGALYSRITPSVAAERPAGTWQTLDITLLDRHVTIKLNGQTIIDNQPVLGPTGGAIMSDVFAPGPIFLQGDHGNVAYRNIVLKPIL